MLSSRDQEKQDTERKKRSVSLVPSHIKDCRCPASTVAPQFIQQSMTIPLSLITSHCPPVVKLYRWFSHGFPMVFPLKPSCPMILPRLTPENLFHFSISRGSTIRHPSARGLHQPPLTKANGKLPFGHSPLVLQHEERSAAELFEP